MGDEREIFLAPLLDFEGFLAGEGFDGRTDCAIEDAVEDAERFPLHAQAVPFRQIVDTAAQDVVLGHDLLDVEGVLDPLQTVGGRTALEQRFSDRLLRTGTEGRDQFRQQIRDVIIERGRIKVAGRREFADLRPPRREQGVALVVDQLCEFVEGIDNVQDSSKPCLLN